MALSLAWQALLSNDYLRMVGVGGCTRTCKDHNKNGTSDTIKFVLIEEIPEDSSVIIVDPEKIAQVSSSVFTFPTSTSNIENKLPSSISITPAITATSNKSTSITSVSSTSTFKFSLDDDEQTQKPTSTAKTLSTGFKLPFNTPTTATSLFGSKVVTVSAAITTQSDSEQTQTPIFNSSPKVTSTSETIITSASQSPFSLTTIAASTVATTTTSTTTITASMTTTNTTTTTAASPPAEQKSTSDTSTFGKEIPVNVFGQQAQTVDTFNKQASPIFGQTVFNNNGFGISSTTNSSFGQSQVFSQSPVFGLSSPTTSNEGSVFGNTTTTGSSVFSFGQTTSSPFGQQNDGNLLGQSSFFYGFGNKPIPVNASKNVFGGNVSSMENDGQKTNLFGNQGASSFGTKFGSSTGGSFTSNTGSVAQSGFGAFQQTQSKQGLILSKI
ncbi:nuclear pore complex protein Nup214-like [Centruroides sculpturatus]|uniref:nuclear pore complex protein Nup214-like n=1 Tax=Centruroides sculpturatus TaxID=218467 RepID=UPI000C6D568E|nr:nuclear pore complex protein Nup214-like [Centruroides sculpturatus]